jgi:hypothetical protein
MRRTLGFMRTWSSLPVRTCTAREFGLDLGDCFHDDEIAEAEAQGLSYILVPRELSREEWEKEYCHALAAEEKKD